MMLMMQVKIKWGGRQKCGVAHLSSFDLLNDVFVSKIGKIGKQTFVF